MIVKTKDRELKVQIIQKKVEEMRGKHLTTHQTQVIIQHNGEPILDGVAYCSAFDQYERLQGRKWALRKAFEKDKDHQKLNRQERTAIFKAVCTKLFPHA